MTFRFWHFGVLEGIDKENSYPGGVLIGRFRENVE
jgi:hypothetical protein